MEIFIAVICFIALLTIFQNNFPVVRKIKINNPELNSIKIVHLSDLHRKTFGYLNCRLSRKIKKLSPLLILMTGDMVSRQNTDLKPLEALLCECSKLCPVYYAFGNHEIEMDKQDFNELMKTISKSKTVILKNQSADIEINQKKINITGLCFERRNFRNKNNGFTGLKPYLIDDINNAVGLKENVYTILLAHSPLYFDTYSSWGADLVLSGHVHGGIIKLPFKKALFSPERKFFPKYHSGIYSQDSTIMYVNTGLGKFRVFNPPEIVLIEFE